MDALTRMMTRVLSNANIIEFIASYFILLFSFPRLLLIPPREVYLYLNCSVYTVQYILF